MAAFALALCFENTINNTEIFGTCLSFDLVLGHSVSLSRSLGKRVGRGLWVDDVVVLSENKRPG
jgi:hypothetical protein